jgi:hypothetical protein
MAIVLRINQPINNFEPLSGKTTDFPDQGVTITIPDDLGNVDIRILEARWENGMGAQHENFEPRRLLSNFEFLAGEEKLTKFSTEVELILYYTQADINFAQRDDKRVDFAYWDGNQWIRFSKFQYFSRNSITPLPIWTKYDFVYVGFCAVRIREWPDPPIAVGK